MTCANGPKHCHGRYVGVAGKVLAGNARHGPFCDSCDFAIRKALKDLRMIRLELEIAYGRTYGSFASPTHAAIPIREDVDAIIRRLEEAVQDLAYAIGREAGLHMGRLTYTEAARRIEAHVETAYQLLSFPTSRWVDEENVPRLPIETDGIVTASGEAVIWCYFTGPDAVRELQGIYAVADRLLSRI